MPIDDRPGRLEREMARDLAPVRPLPPPAVRAVWLLIVAVLVAVPIVSVMGLRADVTRIGGRTVAAMFLVQVAVAAVGFRGALRYSIPGMAGALAGAFTWMAAALCPPGRNQLGHRRSQRIGTGARAGVGIRPRVP